MQDEARRARELRRHERSVGLQWLGRGALAVLVPVAVATVLAGCVLFLAAGLGDRPDDDEGRRRAAYRLDGVAVSITPAEGLAEGTPVTISSEAFRPRHVVAVLPCALSADGTIDQCDRFTAQRFAVPADGRLRIDAIAPRVVTLGGDRAVDCAEEVGRCALLVADVEDRNRSGGTPIGFAADVAPLVPEPADGPPPLVAEAATLEPPGPVAEGDGVTVVAPGFVPGEPVTAGACPAVPVLPGSLDGCAPLVGADFAPAEATITEDEPAADETGVARVPVRVRPLVDGRGTAGDVDCLGPNGCVIAVMALADPQRVALVEVSVVR